MTISDTNIFRAASKLMHRHGTDALSEATRALDKMLDLRDAEWALLCERIRRAVVMLEAPPSRSLH